MTERDLVVCETMAAYTPHLRLVALDLPVINYSGHTLRVRALCGSEIAWDTQLPISSARCRSCRVEAERLGYRPAQGWE